MLKFDKNMFEWPRIKRMLGSQAVEDLDDFLDKLPLRAGIVPLVLTCFMWLVAGGAVLFSYDKAIELHNIQKDLIEAQSLTPTVPRVVRTAIPQDVLVDHIDRVKEYYSNVTVEYRAGAIYISALGTSLYNDWRGAMDAVSMGDKDWRAEVKEMCVGRDCSGVKLSAVMTVEKLDIVSSGQ